MISLFRCRVVSFLLMALPVMSQDVAAPSMANVDLEMEEGKALVRYREAMDRVQMLACVEHIMMRLEMAGWKRREIEIAIIRINSSVPLWMLEKCPPDYRKAFKAFREESGQLLDRIQAEKMDDTRLDKVFMEYSVRCLKMIAPLMEKYDLKERGFFLSRIIEDKLHGLDKAESMKLLQRMKDELITGKMEVPGINENTDDQARGRLKVFVR